MQINQCFSLQLVLTLHNYCVMAMPIFDRSIALLQTAIMGIVLTSFQIRTYYDSKVCYNRTSAILQRFKGQLCSVLCIKVG